MRYKATETDIENAKAVATQLRAGLESLTVAEQTMRVAGERLEQLGLSLYADFLALTGSDDTALDAYALKAGRLEVLKRWVSAAMPLHDSVKLLQSELWKARGIIEAIAQERSIEESSIAMLGWTERLRRVAVVDLPNQMHSVRSIGNQVVRDLEQILSRRVGMVLSAQEIREGILLVAGLGTVRRLTQEERLCGFALE
jgi:hypothetical protein